MKQKNKLIALCSDIDCGCKYVALVKNVDESEYATLLHEQRQYEMHERKFKNELLDKIATLTEKVNALEKEIKVLKGEDDNEEVY